MAQSRRRIDEGENTLRAKRGGLVRPGTAEAVLGFIFRPVAPRPPEETAARVIGAPGRRSSRPGLTVKEGEAYG